MGRSLPAAVLLVVVCYTCLQGVWTGNAADLKSKQSEHQLEMPESQALNNMTAGHTAEQPLLMGVHKDVTHLGVRRHHQHTTTHQHLAIFVGVLSAGSNTDARDAIRQTWGADHRLHRVMFFLAMPEGSEALDVLQIEAAHHKDMLIEPHTREDYFNVTHQTLDMFRAAIVDKAVTHLIKVDDDTYLRVSAIVGLINDLRGEPYMLGNIARDPGGPERENPSVNWYLTREEWPHNTYPMWADGGSGFVISMGLVHQIAAGAAMQAFGGLMKMEDVAVGVWIEHVARKTGWLVNYIHHDGFNANWCNTGDITSHKVSPHRIHCIFEHPHEDTCCFDEEFQG